MSTLAARPALLWALLALVIVANLTGLAHIGGMGLGTIVAACLYRPASGEELIY